jgi:hypothetical protein
VDVAVNQANLKRDRDPDGHGASADPMFSTVQVMADILSKVRVLLFLFHLIIIFF